MCSPLIITGKTWKEKSVLKIVEIEIEGDVLLDQSISKKVILSMHLTRLLQYQLVELKWSYIVY